MNIEDYRAHPSDHYSRLKLALFSAAHYANPPEPPDDGNPALLKGSLLHAYVLESRVIDFVTRPKFDPEKPNELWHGGRKSCKAWVAAQTLPVLKEEDVEGQIGMRKALMDNHVVQEILERCPERERPVFAEYNGLPLKALLDGAGRDNSGRRVVFDLKSCRDSSPNGFAKSVSQLKYTLQLALYSAVLSLEEKLEERPSWLWIAVENKRPYNVAVYAPRPEHYDVGERQLEYCVRLVKECKRTGIYPGYTDGITDLPWRKYDEFVEPEPQPEQ